MGIYLKKCKKKILSKSNKYVGLHSSIFMHADNFRTIDIYFLLHHQGNLDQVFVSTEKSHPKQI